MKKREVDHVPRAAGRITGEKQFIIIGSQSLHGKYPDLPDSLLKSFEVDLMASKNADRTEWLNVIGAYSPFHESFGYYADPVDHKTATLPKGSTIRQSSCSFAHTTKRASRHAEQQRAGRKARLFVSVLHDSRATSVQVPAPSTNPELAGSSRGRPRPDSRPPRSLPPASPMRLPWPSHRPKPPSSYT